MAKDEVVETPETTSEDTSAPEAAAETAAAEATPEQAEAAKEVTQAYVANLKYKFLEQEKEFNPLLKDLVKTPEVEKLVKELHEKADGLDFIKPRFHETRDKLKATETQYNQIQKEIADLGGLIKQGDLDTFFEKIELSPQKVFQWVLQKVQEQEMPPQQRAALEQARNEQKRAQMLESQTSSQQQQLQAYAVQARTAELELATTQPEVRSFADTFDTQVGKPGAFKQEVIKQGTLAFHTTGKDIPVAEAVKMVMDTYGRFINAGATAAKPTPGVVMPSQETGAQTAKAVIPNIQGKGGSSPARKAIKSTDELRQLAQQMDN